ncbi:MAG: uroporphyrinogen-III synthase [Crocinitomicaceae bacterium]|jgi:uroporphyrinogen-III synthase|nr:uroporphyrinogen-III synthase [Crocinitomicaceae bacterium]
MRIFITKHEKETQLLQAFCQDRKWDLESQSLVDLRLNPDYENPTDFDCIFFGSKNAVEFYCSQFTVPRHVSIACVGSSTSNQIINHGCKPQFIGKKSGDPNQVAIAFKNFLGNRTCLFPHSNKSLGTIASLVPEKQKIERVLYFNNSEPKVVQVADVYVFTSPTNVRSFCQLNNPPALAISIAWGQSTAETMLENNIQPTYILKNAQFKELIDVLCQVN